MDCPGVLIVEDDPNLREALSDTLNSGDVTVLEAESGPEALAILEREPIGLVVSDIQMKPMDGTELLAKIRQRHPGLPAVVMTAYGTIETAVDAMRNGAADYLVKPFESSALLDVVKRYLKPAASSGEPVACDSKTAKLLRVAERVAASEATVTITGASGCGKEVFARYIHRKSPRRHKPFVPINCAAIPESMLESVLFGYEKGAFTGASAAHAGKFEQAQFGTLLLDEISEMHLGLQAKLLRVIQEREVERLGGRKPISLNVRVLATTNRNLVRYVKEGKFREDLYYRLNVFPLHIPPLRERTADILPLAKRAIERHRDSNRNCRIPTLTKCAEAKLLAHSWPGNVRELENLIQRSLILSSGDSIKASELVFEGSEAAAQQVKNAALQDELKQQEYRLIVEALGEGSRSEAAAKLGISPRTLRYKLARMREAGITL